MLAVEWAGSVCRLIFTPLEYSQEEQERQKAILANPSYQASPFAALRAHLQNAGSSNGTRKEGRTR